MGKKAMPRFDFTGLYAITDDSLSLGRSVLQVVDELMKSGIRILQYREKDKKAGTMLEDCLAIRAKTRETDCLFIVNDHVDIAMLCRADGVHIGQEDLPLPHVRSLVGRDMIIGLSTHSPAQAAEAVRLGADYIGVGPLYATRTKKDVCEPVGLEYLEHVVKTYPHLPFTAIGGIKLHNIQEVVRHGARCCCVVSEILSAGGIPARVGELRRLMETA
jgi:thiamine-phosphate pyrophosphorylase